MSRVAVKKSILLWVLDRAELTADDLQSKYPKIRQWIKGETYPTLRQLESLAKITMTPLGFFFLDDPPEIRLPVPHYRTQADEEPSNPSPNLLETIQLLFCYIV